MYRNLLAVILIIVLARQLTICQGRGKIAKVIDMINEVHEIFKVLYDANNTFLNLNSTISDVLRALGGMALDLDVVERQFVKGSDILLDTTLDRLPEFTDIRSDMQLLGGYVQRIDFLYNEFRRYIHNYSHWHPFTLLEFSETIANHTFDSVASTMNLISSMIYPRRTEVFLKGLLSRSIRKLKVHFGPVFSTFFTDIFKENELDLCDEERSPQQQIYDLYTTIFITEIRGWLLVSFAHTFRSSFQMINKYSTYSLLFKNAFRSEQRGALTDSHMRLDNYKRMFHEAMLFTSRALRRCDPSDGHTRGETFHEFERFITGWIVRQEELNPHDRCTHTCETSKAYPTNYQFVRFGSPMSNCDGKITNCKSLGSTEVCVRPQTKLEDRDTIRRYEWFKDSNGTGYGNTNEQCEGSLLHLERRHDNSSKCDICLCTCTEDSYRHGVTRFVSLRQVVSDIGKNKVVTGVKFISSKRVIQIQIQEGKLAQNGKIVKDSTSWKEPEEIRFSDYASILSKRHRFFRDKSLKNEIHILIANKDVAIFDHEDRTIHLDELHVPKNHVMTGIKFNRVTGKHNNYYSIQLSIRATPFDYAKGELYEAGSTWITPKQMKDILASYKRERKRIVYRNDIKNPLEHVSKTTPNFEPNQLITIRRTTLRSDAGQTVIPLLDGQEVMANPAVPLAGVNLFHKFTNEYGGFLSFQILSIDRAEDIVFGGIHDETKGFSIFLFDH